MDTCGAVPGELAQQGSNTVAQSRQAADTTPMPSRQQSRRACSCTCLLPPPGRAHWPTRLSRCACQLPPSTAPAARQNERLGNVICGGWVLSEPKSSLPNDGCSSASGSQQQQWAYLVGSSTVFWGEEGARQAALVVANLRQGSRHVSSYKLRRQAGRSSGQSGRPGSGHTKQGQRPSHVAQRLQLSVGLLVQQLLEQHDWKLLRCSWRCCGASCRGQGDQQQHRRRRCRHERARAHRWPGEAFRGALSHP